MLTRCGAIFCLLACVPGSAPAQDHLPDGQGKVTVQRICTQCHGSNVITGTRHTAEGWRRVVTDMVARGAQGSPAELNAVTEYLAAHFGDTAPESTPEKPVTTAAEPAPHLTSREQRIQIPAKEQWPFYGYDAGGTRYSPLTQVTPGNVSHLKRAWTFHLGMPGSEAIPVVINSVMYVTASDGIYAIEPETGRLIWKYPSKSVARRGLAYWPGDGTTHARIFCGVESGKLAAIDASTGKPAYGFGDEGFIDLKTGVADGQFAKSPFFLQSPPAIYKNIIITGGDNNEPAPSRGAYGDVRGWDAHTGKLLWTFHTVPRKGEPGNDTWPPDGWQHRSGTNVWGFLTVDTKRGLVYLPIGAPTYDMYGADRHGSGLYGNSLVALDAATGKVKWFQQLVHHDLWDYDLAAPPALIDVVREGRTTPAVAQITKMGMLFLFDRTNGTPIFGMEERKVPTSHVPGEQSSPTQPFPLKPDPLARTQFDKSDLYSLTPEHAAFCKSLFEQNHMFTEGPFTPMPLEANALTFPSTLGGGNWGGVSYNPRLGFVFVNVMNLGQWGHMRKKTNPATGEVTYERTAPVGGQYARFWDPDNHIPCTNPPFGELVAVNVNTGDIAWRVPLGTMEELEKLGVHHTGTLNLGGSIATASGLTFIGATKDSRLRAFDSRTGKELWSSVIDAPAYTVPVTYRGRDGRQYVAVVAGGGGYWGSPASTSVIAFALPSPAL
jgi:quinoprotein glucose dehydrogenase